AISAALVLVLFHVDHAAGAVAVIAPAVALYSLALRGGRAQRVLAGVAAVAVVALADVLHSGRPTILQTLGHVLLVAIPLLAAEAIRTHRSYLSVVLERLELSEAAREQAAERRAEQERMRIARELHDVVAHTLTEINVQAAAAAEHAPPGSERRSLEQIERTSHTAIGELRAILGVLREPHDPDAPRVPSPGVQNIPELLDRAREAGLQVELDVGGSRPRHVAEAVSLAAYRIVQEALTNARRHAAGAPVSVTLGFGASELSVAVNNGAGANRNGHGQEPGVGITGMLERATAVGGTLRAGPRRDGFEVAAELPYELGR
ncbi:MAG TPA: histidine kinase, partial [Solirubrobacteraceae bacterium]|nr:histidine kinase [Solirubrobacteraceae bacterium]